jgi:hypothetical protein
MLSSSAKKVEIKCKVNPLKKGREGDRRSGRDGNGLFNEFIEKLSKKLAN